jgi:hypothetical protein
LQYSTIPFDPIVANSLSHDSRILAGRSRSHRPVVAWVTSPTWPTCGSVGDAGRRQAGQAINQFFELAENKSAIFDCRRLDVLGCDAGSGPSTMAAWCGGGNHNSKHTRELPMRLAVCKPYIRFGACRTPYRLFYPGAFPRPAQAASPLLRALARSPASRVPQPIVRATS